MRKKTIKQKRLKKEIEELRNIAYGYDKTMDAGTLIDTLEIERDEMIVNRILSDCVLFEETMKLLVMDYILSDSKKWKKIKFFGKINRFRILYDDILSRISPFLMMDILSKYLGRRKRWKIANKLLRWLFTLRNVVAHNFTIDSMHEQKVCYNGKDVFRKEAFREYCKDSNKTRAFLNRLH